MMFLCRSPASVAHGARGSTDRRHSILLRVLLVLLSVSLLLAPGICQGSNRVIHLWVDPYYGSDLLASVNNPNGVNAICTTTPPVWPHDVVDPAQGNTLLLHASWPFKTINGPKGALAYLAGTGTPPPPPPPPYLILPLPHTSPTTGWTWEYAIIHLLPGRYHTSTLHNFDNGLQGNGEVFPIDLPDRVSIQGTSALNTIFELGGAGAYPAFRFGYGTNGNAGKNSFIDSVSIHSAIHIGDAQPPWRGSAIYMAPGVQCEVTISNCFLFGNEVGILMDADIDGDIIHQPMIVNNTIAWNLIGLWNGQINAPPTGSTGVSKPIVINNIFDATPPSRLAAYCRFLSQSTWPPLAPIRGYTGFEGMSSADMTIALPPPPSVPVRRTSTPSSRESWETNTMSAIRLPPCNSS